MAFSLLLGILFAVLKRANDINQAYLQQDNGFKRLQPVFKEKHSQTTFLWWAESLKPSSVCMFMCLRAQAQKCNNFSDLLHTHKLTIPYCHYPLYSCTLCNSYKVMVAFTASHCVCYEL